jgi:hypothetical protein
MLEQLPDTWATRDLPVLRAAVAGVDAEPIAGIRFAEIAAQTGLADEDVYRAAKALQSAGLVGLRETFGPTSTNSFNEVAGAARVHAGQWPSEETALDRMIAALETIAANTADPAAEPASRALEAIKDAGQAFEGVMRATLTGEMP